MQAKKYKTTKTTKATQIGRYKQGKRRLLPIIPEKRYFTIGEVAELCGVRPHVLRYWEQEFPQLSPAKRRGNRRAYQNKDVVLARHIRELLYEKGYTIEGAKGQLLAASSSAIKSLPAASKSEDIVNKIIVELETLLYELV